MPIGMLGLIGLVAVALGYFVSPIFFYIIGGVLFTPFTRYALHGNTEVLVAPIVFVIGGLLWPLVAVAASARLIHKGINWLFAGRI
jgi:hypothetical protein